MTDSFDIVPQGPFDLRRSAEFGFGGRESGEWDGTMPLAFCLDGSWTQVGVLVTQDDVGVVHCEYDGSDEVDAIRTQVARVLSLDFDGDDFVAKCSQDPVIAKLIEHAPGLRPPLFYSPYEAAAWSVLSARRPAKQMQKVRREMSEQFGKVFSIGGQPLPAFPAPTQLLAIESYPGLPAEKIERLHGVAQAALDGALDVDAIHAMGAEAAIAKLQEIRGIGPFYASLIVIRASGFADELTSLEPKVLDMCARLYDLDGPPSPKEFEAMAELWRPFRTWAMVYLRAVGTKLEA